MIVNWNNWTFDYINEKEAIYHLFLLLSIKLVYQSTNVLKDNIDNMCSMCSEILTAIKLTTKNEIKRKEVMLLNRRVNALRLGILKTTNLDGEKATAKIYDFLLRFDNMGCLNGFGFGKALSREKMRGNSERESTVPTVRAINIRNQVFKSSTIT